MGTGHNKGTQRENKLYSDVLEDCSLVSQARVKVILDILSTFLISKVREGKLQGFNLIEKPQANWV